MDRDKAALLAGIAAALGFKVAESYRYCAPFLLNLNVITTGVSEGGMTMEEQRRLSVMLRL